MNMKLMNSEEYISHENKLPKVLSKENTELGFLKYIFLCILDYISYITQREIENKNVNTLRFTHLNW